MEIPTRATIIKQVKKSGLKIAAVLPFHYPRALLRVYGFHPMEIWGPPHVDHLDGLQHFPEYTCKIVQNATRFLLDLPTATIDCILIPHTCDSLQGMASVLKDFIKPDQPILTIYHPRGRRESDLLFMEKELKCLAKNLEAVSGKMPTNEEFSAAIELEDEATGLLAEISQHRATYDVSDREFYTLLRSREYLPTEQFIQVANNVPKGIPELKGPGLMISGIVPEPLELFDRINDLGAHVVIDDLACCSRRIYKTFKEADPFKRMAKQLISMPPDTTVSTPYRERFDYLTQQMQKSHARGVLVYNVKFCEPELFYIPMFEQTMKDAGWPFLFIETELSPEIPQQVLNRINSFVEVLS